MNMHIWTESVQNKLSFFAIVNLNQYSKYKTKSTTQKYNT
jgi:hypothetical protein